MMAQNAVAGATAPASGAGIGCWSFQTPGPVSSRSSGGKADGGLPSRSGIATRYSLDTRRSGTHHLSSPPSAWAGALRLPERRYPSGGDRPMTKNALVVAVRRAVEIGPKQMTAHGLREMRGAFWPRCWVIVDLHLPTAANDVVGFLGLVVMKPELRAGGSCAIPVTRPLLSVRSPVIRSFQRIALLVAQLVSRQPSQSRVAWSTMTGLRVFMGHPYQ